MNFKESVMSVTPKNLPKRTRILVKDLLFQEKYQLTDTQVDIMSYIFNAFTWAMKIEGFMVLTSKKIMDDLPHIGEKTLSATLLELANKGLITRSLVTVAIWRNARVRGIKITSHGMEYNSSCYTPTHQAIVNAFQERIDELEAKNEKLEKESESEALAPKNEASEEKEMPISEADTVDFKGENSAEPKEVKESKEPKESLDNFVKRVRNRFILTSEPICNSVQGWQKETTFYINSYGKLSLSTKNMDFSQLNNPIEINKFWKWLYLHQERIGEVIEFKNIRVNIGKLNQKYRNTKIQIEGKIRWIEKITDTGSGFTLKIRDEEGKVSEVLDDLRRPRVYGYEVFKR
jgi:hypothetical protein